jgi:hypothetical protein
MAHVAKGYESLTQFKREAIHRLAQVETLVTPRIIHNYMYDRYPQPAGPGPAGVVAPGKYKIKSKFWFSTVHGAEALYLAGGGVAGACVGEALGWWSTAMNCEKLLDTDSEKSEAQQETGQPVINDTQQ